MREPTFMTEYRQAVREHAERILAGLEAAARKADYVPELYAGDVLAKVRAMLTEAERGQ